MSRRIREIQLRYERYERRRMLFEIIKLNISMEQINKISFEDWQMAQSIRRHDIYYNVSKNINVANLTMQYREGLNYYGAGLQEFYELETAFEFSKLLLAADAYLEWQ